jgi:hypothetical protein
MIYNDNSDILLFTDVTKLNEIFSKIIYKDNNIILNRISFMLTDMNVFFKLDVQKNIYKYYAIFPNIKKLEDIKSYNLQLVIQSGGEIINCLQSIVIANNFFIEAFFSFENNITLFNLVYIMKNNLLPLFNFHLFVFDLIYYTI